MVVDMDRGGCSNGGQRQKIKGSVGNLQNPGEDVLPQMETRV